MMVPRHIKSETGKKICMENPWPPSLMHVVAHESLLLREREPFVRQEKSRNMCMSRVQYK